MSHRGGRSGFVRVSENGTLTIPDFDGNLFFNTLGNVLLNGRAGLLFVEMPYDITLQLVQAKAFFAALFRTKENW